MAADNEEWLTVRLRLQDARRFQLDSAASAGAIKGVSHEVDVFAKKTELARVETFAWRQGIFTLRRELYGLTVGFGLAGAGLIKLGFDFNEAKDSGTAAFTAIFGNAAEANQEMASLISLTHQPGALSLPGLTESATKLLDFNFTGKDTVSILKDIAHYSAVRNLGSGGFQSLVDVFTTIQSQGKLTSRTMLTLAHMGVDVNKILRDQLHATDAQIAQIRSGKLYVPASVAIPALQAGLATTGGKALNGRSILQIGRSYVTQLAGAIEKPLSEWAVREGPKIDGILARVTSGFQRGGAKGALRALDPSGTLTNAWVALGNVLGAVVTILRTGYAILQLFAPLFSVLAIALGAVAGQGWLLKGVLYVLAAYYTITRLNMLRLIAVEKAKFVLDRAVYAQTWLGVRALQAQELWTGRAAIKTKVLTQFTKEGWVAQKAMSFWTWISVGSEQAATVSTGELAVSTGVLAATEGVAAGATGIFAGAIELLTIAIYGIPIIGWILALVALTATVIVLFIKWKWFHNLVIASWGWITHHWPLLAEIIAAPFTGGLSLILTHVGDIKRGIGDAFHWIEHEAGRVFGWLGRMWNKVPGHSLFSAGLRIAGGGIPGLASGGVINTPGSVLVGERGPEILSLPRSASITPLQKAQPFDWAKVIKLELHPAGVYLDGREVAEVVFKYAGDESARTQGAAA